MTLIGALRGVRNLSIEDPRVPITGGTLIDWMSGPATNAGVAVSEKSALTMPAVWRAVNLIAGSCASLPLRAYKANDDTTRTPLSSGQASDLLLSPHPDLTPFELWEQVYGHLLLWGNAYLRILRNPLGQVAELWPLHPSRIVPGRASDGSKVYQIDQDQSPPLTDREILHIPGFGYDGIAGVPPIRLARQGIGLALAAEEYGSRLFGSGSLASGILQTKERLTQEQADALKQRWKDKNSSLKSAHDTVVLDSGATFQQLTIPPGDAQFIESRKFQVIEIARIYGIPPHLLMDVERSTSWGTGIEQQGLGFIAFTLRPWLTRVEQRVSRLLQPSRVYARYQVEGLLRGDTAARYASYAVGRQWGWLSVNDIRQFEEMVPVEGGDRYIEPLNMESISGPSTGETNQGAPDAASA